MYLYLVGDVSRRNVDTHSRTSRFDMSGGVRHHRCVLDTFDTTDNQRIERRTVTVGLVEQVYQVADNTGDVCVREVRFYDSFHTNDEFLVFHPHPIRFFNTKMDITLGNNIEHLFNRAGVMDVNNLVDTTVTSLDCRVDSLRLVDGHNDDTAELLRVGFVDTSNEGRGQVGLTAEIVTVDIVEHEDGTRGTYSECGTRSASSSYR